MESKEEIKRKINGKVKGEYHKFQVGVTDKPPRRKYTHGKTPEWEKYNPSTENVARELEQYFLKKGMKGGTGGRGSAKYLYIFKKLN
jgi:hypothetical protein